MSERGNVLFLILIAVALFAALSYAVTQSSRGGGAGIDDEKIALATAELMEQVNSMKTQITRLYAMNRVDQIKFDESSFNSAATIQNPDRSTSTGRTIGLFNVAEGGIPMMPPPEAVMKSPIANGYGWYYYPNLNLRYNGDEVGGSTQGEEMLFLWNVNEAACKEINRQMRGTTTIQSTGGFLFGGQSPGTRANRDGTYVNPVNLAVGLDVSSFPACMQYGAGSYIFIATINEN